MKQCPKCGRMNLSNVSVCSHCTEDLGGVNDLVQDTPAAANGMHWFWAWLIMQGIGLAGGQLIAAIISGLLKGLPESALLANLTTYTIIELICRLLLIYLGIFVWIRLTFRRYFYASAWTLFTYLWNITSPIFLLTQFNWAFEGTGFDVSSLELITLAGAVIGVIAFSIYRGKLKGQLE